MNHLLKLPEKKSTEPSHYFSPTSFKSFVELGKNGHYPLFYPSWLDCYKDQANEIKSSSKSKKFAKELIKRMNNHKSLERKRTVLLSLSKDDLMIFIHEFFNMVETKILDTKMELQ